MTHWAEGGFNFIFFGNFDCNQKEIDFQKSSFYFLAKCLKIFIF
jgi:hypothetical protein